MVYQCFTPPIEEPFYTPMEFMSSNPTSPTGGYFPPASVWGAQRLSQIDLSTRSLERAMDVIVEVQSPSFDIEEEEEFPSPVFPFGSHVIADSPVVKALSPALPESPALLPPTPAVGERSPSSPLGRETWPTTAPLRVNSRRLNRKLPPTMTESLEMLVLSHQQQPEHTDSLGSVPEDSPACPGGSPLRPPLRPIKMGTMQKLQQLQQLRSQPPQDHRRTASASFNGKNGGGRPTGLPRSPSMPVVPTARKISNRPSLPRLFSSASPPKMQRYDSCSSGYASSTHSSDWVTTPASPSRPLPSAPVSTPMFDRGPMDFSASMVDFHDRSPTESLESGRPPDVAKLLYASDLEVIDEAGQRVRFGDIVGGTRRTIVIFIRHWLSSFCSQYIKALMAELPPPVLAGSRARLVIIGNGSEEMIAGFRQHFHCPFQIYTDPTRRLHDSLSLLQHPLVQQPPKGTYVIQNAVMRACETLQLAARLHGFRSGDREQLGAEFIFDGSLRVVFSHRMAGVADHTPVADLHAALANCSEYPSRAPVGSRSCVSLPPSKAKKERTSSDNKSERPRRGSQNHHKTHNQPPLPTLLHPTSPTSPAEPLAQLEPVTPKGPALDFPLPPLRVTEEECQRWNQQRTSLLATRRSKSSHRRVFSDESAVTIVNSDDHDLDSITGEVIKSVYAS